MTVVFLAVAIAFGFYIQIGSRGFFLSLFEGSHPLDPQSAWRPLSNRCWSCCDSCAPGLPSTHLELFNQAFRFISVNNHHKYLLSILHLLEASGIILLNPHHSNPLREVLPSSLFFKGENQGTGSCYVAQADLELLASSNPNSSVSQIAEIMGTSHCTWTSSDIIKQRIFSRADATCAYSIFAECLLLCLLCPH
ncbi:uncharacterized protein [Symphalangus syndactylus]|uniref:uncharacterized protein isoform X1 n=1 Tax=Symphalangus syndactylus TaxID=9590 RepID=UPI002442C6A4|nr:uncharacterized protein LOC129458388 isoform X1 [Symphalangus syndactylus]